MARPPVTDRVLRHDPTTGTPITVADTIVRAVRAGNYIEAASAMAGVNKDTVYRWLREGARHRLAAEATDDPDTYLNNLGPNDQGYVRFSDAVAQAQAEAEAEDVALLQSLARGGRTLEHRTVKTLADGSTESTVRSEVLPPDAATIRWRLERRFPDRWGRQRLEVTGAEGGPVELSIDEKRAAVADLLDQVATAAAEAVMPDDPTGA